MNAHLHMPILFVSFINRDIISKYHGFLIEDAKPVLPILHLLFERLGQVEEEVFTQRKESGQKRRSRFATRQSSPPVWFMIMIMMIDFHK